MIRVITDDFRLYFDLKESECKEYFIPTDVEYLSKQRDLLASPQSAFYSTNPSEKYDTNANWVIAEATESETGIILSRSLLEAITANILICLRVESGRYHTTSELAKKWLICTGTTEIPKKYWVKY